jgi:uncharacterized protein
LALCRVFARYNDAVPAILSLVPDLFFSVQIQNAAAGLGWACTTIDSLSQIPAQPLLATQADSPTHIQNTSLGHDFIAFVVELQPVLIVVDLASALPWEQWIIAAKTSPAIRRIPILGFGPHEDTASRQRALAAGAEAVVTKGQLSAKLVDLLQQHARLPNPTDARTACEGELAALARHGIELFNRGEYFDSHEELEHAWKAEPGPGRELYRGILQIAVAYLQITRHNYNGAIKMFLRSRQWLDPLPDICRGVDVAGLRRDAAAVRALLEAQPAERIKDFDLSQLKPIQLVDGSNG